MYGLLCWCVEEGLRWDQRESLMQTRHDPQSTCDTHRHTHMDSHPDLSGPHVIRSKVCYQASRYRATVRCHPQRTELSLCTADDNTLMAIHRAGPQRPTGLMLMPAIVCIRVCACTSSPQCLFLCIHVCVCVCPPPHSLPCLLEGTL